MKNDVNYYRNQEVQKKHLDRFCICYQKSKVASFEPVYSDSEGQPVSLEHVCLRGGHDQHVQISQEAVLLAVQLAVITPMPWHIPPLGH